jgi:hypothetical protein
MDRQTPVRSGRTIGDGMQALLKFEELFLVLLSLFLFLSFGYAWWWFPLLFLAPDLSAVGYLLGPRVGAWTYNLAHHKGIAVLLFVLGGVLHVPRLQVAGLIMLGHSSFDRVLGYGLKYTDSFQHTHLGRVGRGG